MGSGVQSGASIVVALITYLTRGVICGGLVYRKITSGGDAYQSGLLFIQITFVLVS